MEQVSDGTPVHDQHGLVGRVLAVDDDPQSGAIALLVQEVNGELRRLAPGTYQLVDAVVVITAARATESQPRPA